MGERREKEMKRRHTYSKRTLSAAVVVLTLSFFAVVALRLSVPGEANIDANADRSQKPAPISVRTVLIVPGMNTTQALQSGCIGAIVVKRNSAGSISLAKGESARVDYTVVWRSFDPEKYPTAELLADTRAGSSVAQVYSYVDALGQKREAELNLNSMAQYENPGVRVLRNNEPITLTLVIAAPKDFPASASQSSVPLNALIGLEPTRGEIIITDSDPLGPVPTTTQGDIEVVQIEK